MLFWTFDTINKVDFFLKPSQDGNSPFLLSSHDYIHGDFIQNICTAHFKEDFPFKIDSTVTEV